MNVLTISKINLYNFSGKKYVSFCSNPIQNNVTPDLKQYNLDGVSEYYCGPVSAANSMIYLSGKGFYNLINDKNNIVENLAKYLKTDKNGTTTQNLCEGIQKFIKSNGYDCKIIYDGYRPVSSEFKQSDYPDYNKIRNDIDNGKAILLNIGVYKKENGIYKRQYGHFVNAVGYGTNGISNEDNYLTITDPYNKIHGNHYIKLCKIQSGHLIHNNDDNENALINDAKGFYEISPKFNYFEPDEIAVLNGVISIEALK